MPTGTGRFSQRVTLARYAPTKHPRTGEDVPAWVDLPDPVWAELVPLNSREQVRAKQLQVDATHRLTLRYRTDLDAKWRVRWVDPRGSHTAYVTGKPLETVRRRELECQLSESTDGQ